MGNKKRITKKPVRRNTVLDSTLSGKLTLREIDLLKGLYANKTISSKSIILAKQKGLSRIISKIASALAPHGKIDIPSTDYVDRFIDQENIQIDKVLADKEHDALLFVLNNGLVIRDRISRYSLLKSANEEQLNRYNLYAGKTSVEWPELDEDLSLRGLLKDVIFDPIRQTMSGHEGFVMAAG